MSGSVSRSSNPLSAAYRGVAQLFLISMSASLADQRRTDEVSNPDWANHLPGHPASFVRFVRTVGSPQSCSGARYRRSLARVDYGPKPSRSSPTIQVLFFVPGMWSAHGRTRITRARAMPARSYRGATGASPAGVKIEVTGPSCPCPSSSTRMPSGASRRAAWDAMAR